MDNKNLSRGRLISSNDTANHDDENGRGLDDDVADQGYSDARDSLGDNQSDSGCQFVASSRACILCTPFFVLLTFVAVPIYRHRVANTPSSSLSSSSVS